MFEIKEFPPGDRATWQKLIERELGELPQGRPHPFYMRDDVVQWETCTPLWKEPGWKLVSDEYVPGEVAIWRYHRPLPQKLPSKWFIPLEAQEAPAPPSPEIEIYREVLPGALHQPLTSIPVWHLPLKLTHDLEWENPQTLQNLSLQKPMHLSVILDERFFVSILLMRSLRKALQEKGFFEVAVWARPASHLLEVSSHLPEASHEENLIRLTTYAMSAIMGGSSYIYIPAIKGQGFHAERWSRNISHILRYEVPYLFTTPDPLAGSFFIEAETNRLAQELRIHLP